MTTISNVFDELFCEALAAFGRVWIAGPASQPSELVEHTNKAVVHDILLNETIKRCEAIEWNKTLVCQELREEMPAPEKLTSERRRLVIEKIVFHLMDCFDDTMLEARDDLGMPALALYDCHPAGTSILMQQRHDEEMKKIDLNVWEDAYDMYLDLTFADEMKALMDQARADAAKANKPILNFFSTKLKRVFN